MHNKLHSQLDQAERLIREGRLGEAAFQVKRLLKGKIPRPYLAQLAGLTRRAGLPHSALRLLNQYFRPFENDGAELALPAETIQYASTLISIGATQEGFLLLDSLTPNRHPEILFHRSLGLISEWRYAEAIPVLERYLKTPGLTPYQAIVARVNLLASLVYEVRVSEAEALLRSLLSESEQPWLTSLRASVQQLGAILAIHQGRALQAGKFLDEAEAAFRQSARNLNLIKKWRAVHGISFGEPSEKARWLAELAQLAKQAVLTRQWELRRDCEKFITFATGNETTLLALYFGTPFENYRSHLIRDWGKPISLPADFLWSPDVECETGPVVDVKRGEVEGKVLFKRSGILHRLLLVLSQDFFRPIRTAEIHARVFRDAPYHPDASPARVKTAIIRLRQALTEAGLKNAIKAQGNGYGFRRGLRARLRVSPAAPLLTTSNECLGRLEENWPRDSFSAEQAASVVGMPRRSVARVLKSGIAEGTLRQMGQGKRSRYRFTKE